MDHLCGNDFYGYSSPLNEEGGQLSLGLKQKIKQLKWYTGFYTDFITQYCKLIIYKQFKSQSYKKAGSFLWLRSTTCLLSILKGHKYNVVICYACYEIICWHKLAPPTHGYCKIKCITIPPSELKINQLLT